MTGAKRNGFDYPISWPDYLRLIHDGIPEQLLPYRPPSDEPSEQESASAGVAAMSEMVIGG